MIEAMVIDMNEGQVRTLQQVRRPCKTLGRDALPPAHVFFSARPASICGGSNEIQRNILAKVVREPPG